MDAAIHYPEGTEVDRPLPRTLKEAEKITGKCYFKSLSKK